MAVKQKKSTADWSRESVPESWGWTIVFPPLKRRNRAWALHERLSRAHARSEDVSSLASRKSITTSRTRCFHSSEPTGRGGKSTRNRAKGRDETTVLVGTSDGKTRVSLGKVDASIMSETSARAVAVEV